MIKNIVFDMGGVLICYDADRILDNNGITDEADRQLIKEKVFASREWQEYDRGTIEKSEFRNFLDPLPPHLNKIMTKILLGECFAEKQMPPYEFMDEFIGRLKAAGYGIYLLSNAGQDWYHYSKFVKCFRHFDGCFVSSDYKLLKPEAEIYNKFYEVFGLVPDECVFIDDVKKNTDGAVATGMHAICYSNDRQTLPELEAALRGLGVEF